LAKCAEDVLGGGHSVIVDATFSLRAQRALFAELAKRMSARLQVVVCDAPLTVLKKRITDRYAAGTDASEADLAVLDWQLQHREPIDPAESLDVVTVSANPPAAIDSGLALHS
jgi:uncharacterized protein